MRVRESAAILAVAAGILVVFYFMIATTLGPLNPVMTGYDTFDGALENRVFIAYRSTDPDNPWPFTNPREQERVCFDVQLHNRDADAHDIPYSLVEIDMQENRETVLNNGSLTISPGDYEGAEICHRFDAGMHRIRLSMEGDGYGFSSETRFTVYREIEHIEIKTQQYIIILTFVLLIPVIIQVYDRVLKRKGPA
jgi:hypothetical protein